MVHAPPLGPHERKALWKRFAQRKLVEDPSGKRVVKHEFNLSDCNELLHKVYHQDHPDRPSEMPKGFVQHIFTNVLCCEIDQSLGPDEFDEVINRWWMYRERLFQSYRYHPPDKPKLSHRHERHERRKNLLEKRRGSRGNIDPKPPENQVPPSETPPQPPPKPPPVPWSGPTRAASPSPEPEVLFSSEDPGHSAGWAGLRAGAFFGVPQQAEDPPKQSLEEPSKEVPEPVETGAREAEPSPLRPGKPRRDKGSGGQAVVSMMPAVPFYQELWTEVILSRASYASAQLDFDISAVSRLRDPGCGISYADKSLTSAQLDFDAFTVSRLRDPACGISYVGTYQNVTQERGLQESLEQALNRRLVNASPNTPQVPKGEVRHVDSDVSYAELSRGVKPPVEWPKLNIAEQTLQVKYDHWSGDMTRSEAKRLDSALKEWKEHRHMLHRSVEDMLKAVPRLKDECSKPPEYTSPFVEPKDELHHASAIAASKPKQGQGPTCEKAKLDRYSHVRLVVTVVRATQLPTPGVITSIDPYVVVLVVDRDPLQSDGKEVEQWKGQTSVQNSTIDPNWEEELEPADVPVGRKSHLHFLVFDSDTFGYDKFVGQAVVPLAEVLSNKYSSVRALMLKAMVGSEDTAAQLQESRLFVKVRWTGLEFKGGAAKLNLGSDAASKFKGTPHASSARARLEKGRSRRQQRLGQKRASVTKRNSLRRMSSAPPAPASEESVDAGDTVAPPE